MSNQQPAGIAVQMPGATGFTTVCFNARTMDQLYEKRWAHGFD